MSLLRWGKANAYIEILEKGTKDARHKWAEPFLYSGFAIAVMCAGFVCILEPLNSFFSIYFNRSQTSGAALATSNAVYWVLVSISIAKSTTLIVLSIATSICLSAIVDVAIRVGYSIRERELRVSLKSLFGIDCKDLATEVAIVIGDVAVGGNNNASGQTIPPTNLSQNPNWCEPPQDLVLGVAKDILSAPQSEFAILEDFRAVARLFSLLTRSGVGNPSLLTATEAEAELSSTNSTVKCFVSIGLFSNSFTLGHIATHVNVNNALVQLTRESRTVRGSANDFCHATFHSKVMGDRESFQVSFDWDGKVVYSSNQLNGCDMGLISRSIIFDENGNARKSIISVGGLGPIGTTGAGEAIKQIIEGQHDTTDIGKTLETGDFALVFRVSCSNPNLIEHYRTYA